jgi:hypothetical protein
MGRLNNLLRVLVTQPINASGHCNILSDSFLVLPAFVFQLSIVVSLTCTIDTMGSSKNAKHYKRKEAANWQPLTFIKAGFVT